MSRAARMLTAERYAYPTWWVTRHGPAVINLDPEWDLCAGCGRWAMTDYPCPHCAADRAARKRGAA